MTLGKRDHLLLVHLHFDRRCSRVVARRVAKAAIDGTFAVVEPVHVKDPTAVKVVRWPAVNTPNDDQVAVLLRKKREYERERHALALERKEQGLTGTIKLGRPRKTSKLGRPRKLR
jgi:hypothetical protein